MLGIGCGGFMLRGYLVTWDAFSVVCPRHDWHSSGVDCLPSRCTLQLRERQQSVVVIGHLSMIICHIALSDTPTQILRRLRHLHVRG